MKKKENPDNMLDKIVLVATLYYKNKLSQQEIAKKLSISRPWVSKLLSRAEDLGIVKIEINSPVTGNSQLEEALKEKYGLSYAGVISTKDQNRDYVAQAAADYFISQLKQKDVVGVGWGNAVSRFIKELHPISFPDVQTVPLAGSFGESFEALPTYNTLQLANTIGGTAKMLHIPAFCSSKEEYETLISNEHTRQILNLGEHADILLMGLGSFESTILTCYNILNDQEIAELKAAHAIGDVALQFLTRAGETVETEATKHLIKADIFKAAKNARVSIGVADGLHKVQIIDVALNLKLVNSFFTDEETALALV